MILDFAPFKLHTDLAELRNAGGHVDLEPKAFSLLCLLAMNHDRVISKDEMIDVVWGGRFISDAAVSTAIKLVRKALGDDGEAQKFIRTVRGHGHRFVAPVRIRSTTTIGGEQDSPSSSPADTETARSTRPTLAVLPFSHAGLPDSFETIGDAIPAEIISSLARLRWLRVIARESAFRFRNENINLEDLRNVLGAGFCITGRVEIFGKQLIVGIDFVETKNESLIWSERFERSIDDIHSIREEIVSAVISALDMQIPLAEAALARLKPVEMLDAWGAYHLGLSHMYRFNSRDNLIAADLFKRATTLDPGFANAYAARSFTSYQNASMGYTADRKTEVNNARFEAERSIELDPLDPNANFAMGRLHILNKHSEDGLIWLERAVDLSPSYAKGHYSKSLIHVLGNQSKEARASVDIAIGLSPLDPLLTPMLNMRALSAAIEGDFLTAADWSILGSRSNRTHFIGLMITVIMCQISGQKDSATYWVKELFERRPNVTITDFAKALPFTDAGFSALICSALKEAGIPD